MNLYDFVTNIVDKRLPPFNGAGIRRDGGQAHFTKGRGMFFLSSTLSLVKLNGKFVASNTPYINSNK